MAAGLSWIFIKEAPTRVVIIASAAAFAGVLAIVSGSVGLDLQGAAIRGDVLALFMTVMMAGTMVVYRARPATTAALPAALSSVVLLPVAAYFGDPLSVDMHELPVLVLFGLVFALASVTLSEGARRLPSSETALLSAFEVPLAPILAWLILLQTPTVHAIIGGVIIVAAVVYSQLRT